MSNQWLTGSFVSSGDGGIEGPCAWTPDCRSTHDPKFGLNRKENLVSNNLDLNNATEQQLVNIHGINKDSAKKIVEFRNQKGQFDSWEDLRHIPGLSFNTLDILQRQGCTVKGMAA
jgi:hypothetical protein